MSKLENFKFPFIFLLLCLAIWGGIQHFSGEGKDQKASVENFASAPHSSSKSCSNSALFGRWISISDKNHRLTFTGSCHYKNDSCNSTGTYPNTTANEGKIKINVETRDGNVSPECPIIGDANCKYSINTSVTPKQLTFSCGRLIGLYYKNSENPEAGIVTNETQSLSHVESQPEASTDSKPEPIVEPKKDPSLDINSNTRTAYGTKVNTAKNDCDGIPKSGIKNCYYKNIPTIQVSGGTYGQLFWSSGTRGSNISQKQFITDQSFNVRIIARSPSSGTSTFGRTCSPYMLNSTKLRIKVQLHKQGLSLGEEAILTSDIGVPSKVWHFKTQGGMTEPYVLDVINVESNARCTGAYGTPLESCSENPYYGIPVQTQRDYSTECAAFDIQFATDYTYDLPGLRAN